MPSSTWPIAVAFISFVLVCPHAFAQDAEVDQALQQLSHELSRTLPLKVDGEKTLEAIVALRSTLIFKYKFTDESTIRNPRFDPKLYEKHLARSLRNSTCADKNLAELLHRGARFNYLFVDRFGMRVADFTLDAAACSRP